MCIVYSESLVVFASICFYRIISPQELEGFLHAQSLFSGYQGASGIHGGKWLHCICVKPFQQMWCWDQTVCGILFLTRVEDPVGKTNKNSKFLSAPATLSKWKWVPRPLKAAIASGGYPSLMGYGDDSEFPIYDGRDFSSCLGHLTLTT
ncbi:hypothetical protein EDD85DRAFT_785229 [Armillaria nabsnona]|nr:hypothetical protein EDD85DRAFT_785229 [Armillaria nabsnona]